MEKSHNSGEAMLELDSNPACARIPLGHWINLLQDPQTGLFSQATCLTLHLEALLVPWFDGYTSNYRLRHNNLQFLFHAK